MKNTNELELWLALEKLSGIDNEEGLFHESQTELSRIYPGTELVFYKIHLRRNGQKKPADGDSKPSTIVLISDYFDNSLETTPLRDPHLKSCYEENTTVKYNSVNGRIVYVFPLGHGNSIQYLLKVTIPGYVEEHCPSLLHFFNILINYYAVIRSNERDFLTGMYNRRAFNRVMSKMEIHPGARHAGKFDFLTILDIDFFKSINDNFGHMIGDEVLILFSRILRENIRAIDVAFRTGGEEFVIVTCDLTAEDIRAANERLRSKIEKTIFPQINKLTVSGGYTRLEYPLDTYFALKKADCALYYAKDHGRNQIFSYEDLVENNMVSPVSHFKEVIDIW